MWAKIGGLNVRWVFDLGVLFSAVLLICACSRNRWHINSASLDQLNFLAQLITG